MPSSRPPSVLLFGYCCRCPNRATVYPVVGHLFASPNIYIYIKAMFGEKRAKAFFRAVDKKGGGRAEDEATRGGRKRTAAMMGGRLRFLSNRRPFREVSSSSRNEKASSLPAISLESRLSD